MSDTTCIHRVKIRLLGLDPRMWECADCGIRFSPSDPGHPNYRTGVAL